MTTRFLGSVVQYVMLAACIGGESESIMHCDIYKSSSRDELYIYIARPDYPDDAKTYQDPFARVPSDLRKAFGRPSFVMHLELDAGFKLARVPVLNVLASFKELGYFVQFPPDGLISPTALPPEGLRGA